ncbi:MAG: SDR family oxidoreductase [Bacteroidales bacterium]|nr:SDR family oxidoreductase [Bacteroidales bacterium]
MKNKVVIVTGASSGIGLATAREFAARGSKVVLAARREDLLKELENDFMSRGYEALAVKTDVTVIEDCENLIDKTIEKFGKIDILVNNAGISMRALFIDVDIQVLRRLMEVNFWGTVYCTKFALPYLIKAKGTLVGVSSVAGFHGLPGRSGYSASKFAMHGFMETLRIENLKNGLHVMVLSAGFTKSEIRKKALTEDGSEQGYTPRIEEKMMMPEQVAKSMIRAIKKKKRVKILTLEGQLIALLQRIVPGIVDRGAYNELAKEPDSPFK